MFDRFKKVFAKPADVMPEAPATPLTQWAQERNFKVERKGRTDEFSMTGQVGGWPFRMDNTPPTRAYIKGQELRARVELDADPVLAVMVITRSLREALEHRAYEKYTDSVQTTLDSGLPEEARWLAMYDELGWESGAVPGFWGQYSVVADARATAQAWIGPELMRALLDWPDAHPHLPRIMMLQRGRLYLRMEFTPAGLATLQHVVHVLEQAAAGVPRATA